MTLSINTVDEPIAYPLLKSAKSDLYKSEIQMYNWHMTTLSIAEARQNFAAAVQAAQSEPVTIEKRGQREAVLISPALFDRLVETAEELADIDDLDAAVAESSPMIPWDQVKADLGWA